MTNTQKQTINTDELSTENITYIKSLVSASIRYLESYIKVIPIDGPLLVSRYETSDYCSWYIQENTFRYPICTEEAFDNGAYCHVVAQIPDDHLDESWYANNDGTSSLYASAGPGIADTDLVIYVTYHWYECSEYTLAWASSCVVDQYGRPVAGTINFCERAIEGDPYWKFDVGTTLHEITHVLVFSNYLYPYFYGQNYDDVIELNGDTNWIITDRVREISREHFSCNTLNGAPLESLGGDGTVGSHWEDKYLMYDYMIGTAYNALLYNSYFTLALLEDSGWYKVDFNYSEPYNWGRNEGCTFFETDCAEDDVSNFDQFWCDKENDHGCTFDNSAIGYCLDYVDEVPVGFRYVIYCIQ